MYIKAIESKVCIENDETHEGGHTWVEDFKTVPKIDRNVSWHLISPANGLGAAIYGQVLKLLFQLTNQPKVIHGNVIS